MVSDPLISPHNLYKMTKNSNPEEDVTNLLGPIYVFREIWWIKSLIEYAQYLNFFPSHPGLTLEFACREPEWCIVFSIMCNPRASASSGKGFD